MNKRKVLNALRSAFSALLLRRAAVKKVKGPAPLLRWVERRPDYFLDRHGAVRRTVAKKPTGMSARQYRKLKKDFRRQAKLHPFADPVSVAGRLAFRYPSGELRYA